MEFKKKAKDLQKELQYYAENPDEELDLLSMWIRDAVLEERRACAEAARPFGRQAMYAVLARSKREEDQPLCLKEHPGYDLLKHHCACPNCLQMDLMKKKIKVRPENG